MKWGLRHQGAARLGAHRMRNAGLNFAQQALQLGPYQFGASVRRLPSKTAQADLLATLSFDGFKFGIASVLDPLHDKPRAQHNQQTDNERFDRRHECSLSR